MTSFICSCELFNSPVKNFFKEYTENAAVEDYELDGEYPKDKDGNICLSSDSTKTLTFTLRNPQEYVLNLGHSFNDAFSQAVKNTVVNPVILYQKPDDTSIFYAVFSPDLLVKLDCGGDFSSTFTLTEPKSMREFSPYKISLKVNSVPQAVRNLTMLQDSSTGKYVLAFNMPDLTGIHRDIESIKINDDTFPVTPTGIAGDGGITGNQFSTKFENNYLPAMANGAEFAGKNAARSIYYKTNVALQLEEYPFSVILTDSAGLSVTAKVSSSSEKLDGITFDPADSGLIEQDSNGYGHVKINAPTTNSDATVYYNVYYPNGRIYKQGGKKGSVELLLGMGRWKVEAWAHKEGYMDSDTSTINPKVHGLVYVNPSYTGDVQDGGRNTPFTSITDVINNVIDEAEDLEIELLGDCVVDKTLTLKWPTVIQGGRTISGAADVIFDVNNDKSLTLVNTNITKGLKLGKKTVLVLKETSAVQDVTMGEGALIKLDNLTGTGKFGKITYAKPSNNLAIIESANSTLLTLAQVERFTLNNPGYFLDIEEGKGVIKVNGVVLVNNEKSNVLISIDGLEESDVSGIYTVNIGDTVSVSFKNESGISVVPDSVTIQLMNVYMEGSPYLSSNTSSITLAGDGVTEGTYNLYIKFEYKGKSYGSTVIVTLQ